MIKASSLAAMLVAGLIAAAPAGAADKGGAVATVNGQAIPQNTFNAFIAQQKAQGTPDSPELQAAVKEELIRREILVQEAKKKGLGLRRISTIFPNILKVLILCRFTAVLIF